MVKKYIPIGIVVFFAFFSVSSLFHHGFYPTHDGEYHIVRFYEFYKTLTNGDIYPRWAADLNNGHGAPLFTYVYPLPNYLAALLHSFGISFIDGYKLQMIVASVVGAIFFYLWSRQFFKQYAAAATAIIYTFSPYHFVDIYIRGSIGEVWALALFPAFLWTVTAFMLTHKKYFFLMSVLFTSAIIFSHNILALMFFPLSVIYVVIFGFSYRTEIKWYMLALVFVLGLGISAVFWLPALFEKNLVNGLQIYGITLDSFPELYQLLIPSWGSGFATGDLQNQISYQLGVVNILAVFLATCIFFVRFFKKYREKDILFFFLIIFYLCCLLMLSLSLEIWKIVPFMNYFQFPWRFLSLTILLSSFIAGFISIVRGGTVMLVILALLSIVVTYGYIRPAYYFQRSDVYYLTKSNFIDGTNSPGNVFNTIWFERSYRKNPQKITVLKGSGVIREKLIKPTKYIIAIDAKRDMSLQVNTAFFPGWVAYDGSKQISLREYRGIMVFNLLKGKHTINIVFKSTFLQNAGAVFSVFSLFSLLHFVRIIR